MASANEGLGNHLFLMELMGRDDGDLKEGAGKGRRIDCGDGGRR